MKRTPIKRKSPRNPIPPDVLRAVNERSGGKCEYSGVDFMLDNAHIEPKKMGGVHGERAKLINDKRNIVKLNRIYHAVMDDIIHNPELREDILRVVKAKTGWDEWEKEYQNWIKRKRCHK